MRAYACARESGIIGIFTIQFSILNLSFHEGAFSSNIFFQNDPSLFPKRPVTFLKMTRHFSQNDPSFYPYLCFNLYKTKLFHYVSFLLNLYALRFSLDGTHNGGTANISFVAPPFGEN